MSNESQFQANLTAARAEANRLLTEVEVIIERQQRFVSETKDLNEIAYHSERIVSFYKEKAYPLMSIKKILNESNSYHAIIRKMLAITGESNHTQAIVRILLMDMFDSDK